MGFAEIFFRINRSISARLEQNGYGLINSSGDLKNEYGLSWLSKLPKAKNVDRRIYVEAAGRILTGRYRIFAMDDINLDFPPNWNQDPKTGTCVPLVFGKTLDYRREENVGDIKYLWEPNRHLELVTLAQAFYLTAETKYSEACARFLESWFEQCPYPLGPNWTSSLENAIRLVNWSFAWFLLGGENSNLFSGENGDKFRKRWLDSIYQHCHFISGHFSQYSSANNHLLGEYMGLFIASTTWPMWEESRGWQSLAKKGFEREALEQNYDDGVNKEQGIWYHHEVADMMLLCGLTGKENSLDFSISFWRRLEKMLEFIASLMDIGGNVPMIGDSDDAVMVRLSQEKNFNVYQSLLATGAVVFERNDFKGQAGNFDEKSRWLLGDEAANKFDSLHRDKGFEVEGGAYPVGGYYILGSDLKTTQEIRCVVDAGPLGYLSIAAHGHADALSFVMSVSGREILIDPGTFAYHTQEKWREYFRGTSAHNTLRVDGLNQSVSGGKFMWTKHYDVVCNLWKTDGERDHLIVSHNGYQRLGDPVVHQREFVFNKKTYCLKILDTLICDGEHSVERFWHFSENCELFKKDCGFSVVDDGVSIQFTDVNGGQEHAQVLNGSECPIGGWISRRFDRKVSSTTVIWKNVIQGTTTMESFIKITRDSSCSM